MSLGTPGPAFVSHQRAGCPGWHTASRRVLCASALPAYEMRGSICVPKSRRVHLAPTLDDLKVPPGNRLEALAGDRAGQHSIRINDQWRVCFRWHQGHAHSVQIVDYH